MSRDRSGPRWISQHLGGSPTPRASELTEATPEGNVEGGGTVVVESTRTSPGAGPVIMTADELAEHVDDDSHLDADGELVEVEPVEPIVRAGAEPSADAPPGSPPAPPEGETDAGVERLDNTADEDGERPELTAAPGEPGTYTPAAVGDDRPETIAELNERVRVESDAPWYEGAWLPYGNGKRAHWHGAGWATGSSPGYTAG